VSVKYSQTGVTLHFRPPVPEANNDAGYLREKSRKCRRWARRHPEVHPTFNDCQGSLLFLLRDPIKKALSQAVAEMPWAEETAPPRAERDRQLEKLDREIATLEKQEKELLEQAAGLGIRV
jgi:hypothetical protein